MNANDSICTEHGTHM